MQCGEVRWSDIAASSERIVVAELSPMVVKESCRMSKPADPERIGTLELKPLTPKESHGLS